MPETFLASSYRPLTGSWKWSSLDIGSAGSRRWDNARGCDMDNRIHFVSGLPRAGSTVLSAILRQNPVFHAAMTSPVGSLYMAMETAMSRRNEIAVFLDVSQRRALLRGVFSGYYCAVDLVDGDLRHQPAVVRTHGSAS